MKYHEEDESFREQVPPGDLSEKAVEYRRKASIACANCPGYCCLRFTSAGPERLKKSLEAGQTELSTKSIREMEYSAFLIFREGFVPRGGASLRGGRRLKELHNSIYELGFMLENFIPVGSPDGNTWGNQVYRCRKFDEVKGRCTAYESRPNICRQFICRSAALGARPPFLEFQEAKPDRHPELTEVYAKSVNKPVSRPTALTNKDRRERERQRKRLLEEPSEKAEIKFGFINDIRGTQCSLDEAPACLEDYEPSPQWTQYGDQI